MLTAASLSPLLPSEIEPFMLATIRRAHSGRWPTWRAYEVRRSGQFIYEVARWLRCRSDKPYSVLAWNLAEASVSWRSFRTLAEARRYAIVLP